jgi:replicative DNA helicase
MAENDTTGLDLNEVNILGNVLFDSGEDAMLAVSRDLVPEDFMDPRNRTIYKVIIDLWKKNIHPDLATLTNELKNQHAYEEIGGADYLNKIAANTLSVAPLQNYVSILKERSLLNRFLTKLRDLQNEAAAKPIENVSEFIGKAEEDILKITRARNAGDYMDASTLSENLVSKFVEQTEFYKKNGIKPNGITGTPTGYGDMDNLTKGWHKGDMIVVGARPSVGKTAFALNLLYQVAKKGTPVIFFSLEMNALSIAMRLLEMTSGLTQDEINSLEFMEGSTKDRILINAKNDKETAIYNALQRGMNELSSLPFYINDNPGSKMMDIAVNCQKLKNLIPNVGLIAIDYIGLITAPSSGRGNSDSRQQEVADISRQIKQLARTIEVPIIALSQLSRDSVKRPDHRPQLSDLRDSGAIEQDADLIFMLYRADYYNQPDASEEERAKAELNNPISSVDVSLVKNRNGQIGLLSFIFDKPHCSFSIAQRDPNDDSSAPDQEI